MADYIYMGKGKGGREKGKGKGKRERGGKGKGGKKHRNTFGKSSSGQRPRTIVLVLDHTNIQYILLGSHTRSIPTSSIFTATWIFLTRF